MSSLQDTLTNDPHDKGKRTPPSPSTERWSGLRHKSKIAKYVAESPSSNVIPSVNSHPLPENLDYLPSSSHAQPEPPASEDFNNSKANHKPENNVEHVARTFIEELTNLLVRRCGEDRKKSIGQWDLDSDTR